jgi:NADH:ubiquinone oxidoreductase subunit 6 (subunit J)
VSVVKRLSNVRGFCLAVYWFLTHALAIVAVAIEAAMVFMSLTAPPVAVLTIIVLAVIVLTIMVLATIVLVVPATESRVRSEQLAGVGVVLEMKSSALVLVRDVEIHRPQVPVRQVRFLELVPIPALLRIA